MTQHLYEMFRMLVLESVVAFYNGALKNPQKLRHCLNVHFTNPGEVGCDAGGIKEFFEEAIYEVSYRLFEGDDFRKVPKKDMDMEILFQVCYNLKTNFVYSIY